jgi:hypothetical protein
MPHEEFSPERRRSDFATGHLRGETELVQPIRTAWPGKSEQKRAGVATGPVQLRESY